MGRCGFSVKNLVLKKKCIKTHIRMTSQPVAMVNGTGAKISHQNLGSFLLRIEPRPAQAVLYNVFLFTHMVLLSSIS